jgi:hypothetical protein
VTATPEPALVLCGDEGCRLRKDHSGKHERFPVSAWAFFESKDKDKLDKAGYATPRGGAKGAYQNHVVRSNRVIIPYKRLDVAPLAEFEKGYIVCLSPEEYFSASGTVKPEFVAADAKIKVGENAFILYRTKDSLTNYPPLAGWRTRQLFRKRKKVKGRRGKDLVERGHYVVRIPPLEKKGNRLGEPQGVFAPEYANADTNYLCRCVLAWLTVHTVQKSLHHCPSCTS